MEYIGLDAAVRSLLRRIFLKPISGPEHCPRCDRRLPRDAFHNDVSRPTGRYAICRDCVSLAQRRYWATLCAPKRREKLARTKARSRTTELERARTRRMARNRVVAQAMARGLAARLAQGLAVDGRRSWDRPDRRASA